jgi:hypothetical protein
MTLSKIPQLRVGRGPLRLLDRQVPSLGPAAGYTLPSPGVISCGASGVQIVTPPQQEKGLAHRRRP